MRRFMDASDEYRETGSKSAAKEKLRGMREGSDRDYAWAQERVTGALGDDYKRRIQLMRDMGVRPFRKEE
jgi:hypothetical protein